MRSALHILILLSTILILGVQQAVASDDSRTYVVIFNSHVQASAIENTARQIAAQHGGHIRDIWKNLGGFAVDLPNAAAAAGISHNPNVEVISENRAGYPAACGHPLPYDPQIGTYWNLDILDGVSDSSYFYCVNGTGTTIYIMDTGINRANNELTSSNGMYRVIDWYDAAENDRDINLCSGLLAHNHGTNVASIAAGSTLGVARGANIVDVKIGQCPDGSSRSDIVARAVDWILGRQAVMNERAVANFSFAGWGVDPVLETALSRLVNTGRIFLASAVGNNSEDSCSISPSRMRLTGLMTVGALDRSEYITSYSGRGACVDIWAPGGDANVIYSRIKVAMADNYSWEYAYGTSLAAPHVAGVAAKYLQLNGNLSPWALHGVILNDARYYLSQANLRDKEYCTCDPGNSGQ